MNETLNPRAQEILRVLAAGDSLSRAAIQEAISETRINTIRELRRLFDLGYVAARGESRATTYAITDRARTLILWDIDDYLAQEPDQRPALYTSINPTLFDTVRTVFRTSDLELVHHIHEKYAAHRAANAITA